MTTLAVAVLGPDRPGVIAALTEVLLAEQGNLADASMTILRGQFAMTLVVETPVGPEQARHDLGPVAERLGLVISVSEVLPHEPAPRGMPYVVRVHGVDRPGIVHRVAGVLAAAGGNITDLATRLSGTAYVLIATVELPGDPAAVARGLAELADELGVDASLSPVDAEVL